MTVVFTWEVHFKKESCGVIWSPCGVIWSPLKCNLCLCFMWSNHALYNPLAGFSVFNGDALYINDSFFDIIKITLHSENVTSLVHENRHGA